MSLDVARFAQYEHKNQIWVVTAETGTSIKDVLEPQYFANVANRMQPYDHICVRVDTGEWYAELLVVTSGKNWAKTVVLFKHEFEESINETAELDENFNLFSVVHRGPHCKWSVIRKSDKEVIKEHCNTRGEAQAWLSSYIMTL